MRNWRRNWGNNDRPGNQYQPGIVFRNPGSGAGNNQGSQNPQDKGKGKAVANDDSSDSKGPCQICLKTGHTAAECWHRFKKNFMPQPNRRRETRGAYVASTDGQSSGVWYLDSGATNHVTNALGNISMNSKYQVSESIRSISDPVSMISFSSNGNESASVNESSVADKSGVSIAHKGYVCMSQSGRIYISASVKFNENSFPLSNDRNFNKKESMSERDFNNLSESFQVMSFLVNDLHNLTQPLGTYSHSQDTAGIMEHTPNLVQDEAQHTLDTDTLSGKHLSHQPLSHIPEDSHNSSPTTEPNTQDIGKQKTCPSHPMITRSKAGIFKPKLFQTSVQLQYSLPKNTPEALKEPKWRRAMEDEYNALMKNKTWTLIPNSQNYKLVGNKWVYRVKENPDGTINKFKARLVAKGFLQTPGVDFKETFSPVVKVATIKIVLTLAVNNDWKLRQVDINNAFLNCDLTETVYMPQPKGFEDKNKPNHICKLIKALYGLRQAPRAWFDKLKSALYSWNFENSKCDTSLFFRRTKSDIIIMLIYVDDMIITGSNCQDVEEVVVKLSKTFALKDIGDLNFFLGIQVARTHDTIQLSQTKYIQDLLTKIEMTGCKEIETPFSTSKKLKRNEGARFHDPTLYRSVIGSLQYAVLTRPELAFSVNKLSQYMFDPRQPHWTACKRIMRYLKNTMNMCLRFRKSEYFDITAYTDADWASDLDDKRSISGYCVYLGNNLVAWSSRKQGVVARSTAESEYRAMALCSTEITWISSLLSELKLKVDGVPVILSDSTSAAAIAANPVYHSKAKHFEIDLHFIRDKVMKGEIEISYVASKDQTADVLTKPLPHYKLSHFRSKLNVIDKTLCLREGVEINDCEKPTTDSNDKLACHLSCSQLQYENVEDEMDLLSWQNGYAEESQYICMQKLRF
ncbi:retrovirus-related pol polyprotein from transposon RE1 [Citrus sinensis]|uniref:Retrovirus-related pol polyprotein from transposon RE1 n=1 Tax=Citrus sinensis TaxID=2711 RepID=A0ACB8IIA8_CITSI|nr:retrovirus-related pol polyprotein from transposon RE1 [Citrus sinensis]